MIIRYSEYRIQTHHKKHKVFRKKYVKVNLKYCWNSSSDLKEIIDS